MVELRITFHLYWEVEVRFLRRLTQAFPVFSLKTGAYLARIEAECLPALIRSGGAPGDPTAPGFVLTRAFSSVKLPDVVRHRVLRQIILTRRPIRTWESFFEATLKLSPSTVLALVVTSLLIYSVLVDYEPSLFRLTETTKASIASLETQIHEKATTYFIDAISSVAGAFLGLSVVSQDEGSEPDLEGNGEELQEPVDTLGAGGSLHNLGLVYGILSHRVHTIKGTYPTYSSHVHPVTLINLKVVDYA